MEVLAPKVSSSRVGSRLGEGEVKHVSLYKTLISFSFTGTSVPALNLPHTHPFPSNHSPGHPVGTPHEGRHSILVHEVNIRAPGHQIGHDGSVAKLSSQVDAGAALAIP